MGISQLPQPPIPTAKGSIAVGTGTGTSLLPVSSTNNLPLVTDSTQNLGLKYAAASKVWTCYGNMPYASLSGFQDGQEGGRANTKVYYLGGYYIFGTNTGVIGYSTDAKNWNYQIVLSAADSVNAIAFNGTTWVVAGNNNKLFSGTLGGTWTARTSQLTGTSTIFDVLWVGGSINLFLLGGNNSATSNVISTSPDGITWTARLSLATAVQCFQVNTAQTTIVASTVNFSTASQQARHSTDGTSWTATPISTAATAQGLVIYYPHIDKFAATNGTFARRSPASVGTNWSTAIYEQQAIPNNIIANLTTTNTNLSKFIPIWDSVNNLYYLTDQNDNVSNSASLVLTTFNNGDILSRTDVGQSNRYSLVATKRELPGVSSGSGNATSAPNSSSAAAFGYGNGIWVIATGAGTDSNTTRVFSTAS